MKRSGPIPRRTRLRTVNPERRKRLYQRNFHSRKLVRLVKFSGCCASCGMPACLRDPAECSHAEVRGMGGAGATWKRIFRQCWACHRAYEGNAERFLAERGCTVADVERWIRNLQREALAAGIITEDELREAA